MGAANIKQSVCLCGNPMHCSTCCADAAEYGDEWLLSKESSTKLLNICTEKEKLNVFLFEEGVVREIFDEFDIKNASQIKAGVEGAREISFKMLSVSGLNLNKVLARCIPGGSPDNPLSGLESMSVQEVSHLCRVQVANELERTLLMHNKRVRNRHNSKTTGVRTNLKFAASLSEVRKTTFGPVEDYVKDMVDVLGFPSTKLLESMKKEHCSSDDSHDEFRPGNYDNVASTPAIEWRAVTNLEEGSKLTKQGRRVRSVDELLKHPDAVRAGLLKEEVLALQLYTGPMFAKYTSVLKQFPDDAVKALRGNMYVTTIFCINSGITKLSHIMKLPDSRCVWRGLKNIELPEDFLSANAMNFRGGLERSMMSTTLKKEVAMQNAGKQTPILFKIELGAINRGADLSFLSQYPEEAEILFPAYSYLEFIQDVQFETLDDGTLVRIVPLKVNANPYTSTIEKFLEPRKSLHTSMLKTFHQEIKCHFADQISSHQVQQRMNVDGQDKKPHMKLRDSIMDECAVTLDLHARRNRTEFDIDVDFHRDIKRALEVNAVAQLKFQLWLEHPTTKADILAEVPLTVLQSAFDTDVDRSYVQVNDEEIINYSRQIALATCVKCGYNMRDISQGHVQGANALIAACTRGNYFETGMLMAAGCKCDAKNDEGSTALMAASAGGFIRCVELLLSKKANVMLVDQHDRSCLHFAVEGGHLEVVKLLCSIGGKDLVMLFNTSFTDDMFYLRFACQKGYLEIVKLLCTIGGRDLVMFRANYGGQSDCLHQACEGGHMEIVELLCSIGGKELVILKQRDGYGWTGLHFACEGGFVEIVKLLCLIGGKDLVMSTSNSKEPLIRHGLSYTTHKETCLHLACGGGHLEVAKILCLIGGEELVMMTMDDGTTCLHFACKGGHLEIVKLLCSIGGKDLVMLGEKYGERCLLSACEGGHLEIVQILCSIGGKELVMIKDEFGTTSLHMACKGGHLEIVKLLCSIGGKGLVMMSTRKWKNFRTCLHFACKGGHLEVVKLLCSIGCKDLVMLEERDYETSLHLACKGGYLEIVRLLCSIGGKNLVMFTTLKYGSCLHLACGGRHLNIVKVLCSIGGKELVMLTNDEKRTPLDVTMQAQEPHPEIVAVLEAYTTEINTSAETSRSSGKRR